MALNIGQKISVSLLLSMAIMVGLVVAIVRPAILKQFTELQAEQVTWNLGRSHDAVATEIEALARQTQDWGSWDDTYEFIQGKNERFRKIKLTTNVYETSHLDILGFVDSSGKVKHFSFCTPDGKVHSDTRAVDIARISNGTPSAPGPSASDHVEVKGIDNVMGIPTLICARPILTSNGEGPTKGTIIFGRFLTQDVVEKLSSAVRVPFKIIKVSDLRSGSEAQRAFANGNDQFIESPVANRLTKGFQQLKNSVGSSTFAIASKTEPTIVQDGIVATNQLISYLATIYFIACALSLIVAHFLVAKPVNRLSRKLKSIDNYGDYSIDAQDVKRNDEIGSLARSFQALMERLALANQSLLEASREAGMAEVARGVLHNAGNVLNSVTVSARELQLICNRSKTSGLSRVCELLDEHRSELGSFLSNDPKGTKIPEYLRAISESLESELEAKQCEIDRILASTKHLNEIVQAQHVLAIKPKSLEDVNLDQVLGGAIDLVTLAFQRHGITLKLELEPELVVRADRSTLVQVFVNILTNAKEALRENPITDRLISVTVARSGLHSVEIRVADNGMGFPPDSANKLFEQGVSSKDGGTGFGLHFCANVLAEMGWSIRAESEGVGKGATFVLTSESSYSNEVAA